MTLNRWRWPVLVATLLAIALALAWADSALLGHFAHPFVRARAAGPAPGLAAPLPGFGFRSIRLSPIGGLFSFWWFVSLMIGLVAIAILAIVSVPGRIRSAIAHLETGGGPPVALLAGIATLLLLGAFSFVMRLSVILLPLVGVIWAAGAIGVIFGAAALAHSGGGLLRRRLGPVHPVVAAFTALLVMADLALIPYAGAVLLALICLTGLGVSVMTRFGSARGWSLDELEA